MGFDYKKIAYEFAGKASPDFYEFTCYKTNKPIGFAIQGSAIVYPFESMGECVSCNKTFHESVLALNQYIEKTPWPVVYEGAYCQDCHKADQFQLEPDEMPAKEVE